MVVVVCDEAVMVAATISANVWMRMVAPTEGGGGVSDDDRCSFVDGNDEELFLPFWLCPCARGGRKPQD